MANEFDQLMAFTATVQQMLAGIEASNVMHKYIRAYDQFAADAMMTLLERFENVDVDIPKLAASAWEIADAMMVERRKRGIGGVDQTSTPPAGAVVPGTDGN